MRLEQNRAERGRERQGVDRGDEHRHRHGDGELAEQLAGDARQERDRDEHRQQHKRDGDDRSGDLAHGTLRRLAGRQLRMVLHHRLDVLDDDDRVIHDDADGQHDGEQRDRSWPSNRSRSAR